MGGGIGVKDVKNFTEEVMFELGLKASSGVV